MLGPNAVGGNVVQDDAFTCAGVASPVAERILHMDRGISADKVRASHRGVREEVMSFVLS